jgi:hypothetical protein
MKPRLATVTISFVLGRNLRWNLLKYNLFRLLEVFVTCFGQRLPRQRARILEPRGARTRRNLTAVYLG